MNYRHHFLGAAAMAAAMATSPAVWADTQLFTSRAAYAARLGELNGSPQLNLPEEIQTFSESIPGSNASTETGPGQFTYRDVPLAVNSGTFGVFNSAAGLGYQGNGSDGAPLVIETSVPVNAIGFDIIGFGSRNVDPFQICLPPDYELRFSGGDLVNVLLDTETASGNGDDGNTQFVGIVDTQSPFSIVELKNTGFFDGSICGFSGTEPDQGDTLFVADLSFGVADFAPLCGDVDDSRIIDADDAIQLRERLAGNSTLLAPDNCSVRNGADSCDMVDAVVIARAADIPTGLPGVQDVCRSNSPNPPDLADRLIGYWPFDGNRIGPDSEYVNHSPRGLRANLTGAGDASRTAGKVGGGALSLPDVGTNGFAQVLDGIGEDTFATSDTLSLVAWLRPTGPGASPALGGTVFSKAGEWELFRRPDGTLRWQKAFGSGPSDVDFGTSAASIPLNEWTHVALTIGQDLVTLYINGQQAQTWPTSPGIGDTVTDNDTLRLGSSATAAGRQYEGDIDEAAIWLRDIDAPTIAFLYDSGFGRKAHELRVFAANLDVSAANEWRVTETAGAPATITTNTVNPGDVQPQLNGSPLYAEAGVLIPTIRETRDGPSSNLRLATAYSSDGEWISMTDLDGNPVEVNARVSFAYFPFAEGWIGGRVLGNGTLNFGSGVTNANVARTGVGNYFVTIPGVTDPRAQGMLYAVDANNTSDNLVMTNPTATGYEIVAYDNDQNFGAGQDIPWNFVYIPYDAPYLVAAEVDQLGSEINGTGNSFVSQITGGITEITIPGEHYRRGMLLLGAGFTPNSAQDNLYTYAPGGSGRFVSHSRDLPNEGLQVAQYTYAYVSFDRPPVMPTP